MEIDEAIRGSDDTRLKTKYNNAVYVIQRALALYPYVSFISILKLKLHFISISRDLSRVNEMTVH